ncbi:MAG: hypothetical protein ACRD1K_17670 [Acidimicrobiales bacterium]
MTSIVDTAPVRDRAPAETPAPARRWAEFPPRPIGPDIWSANSAGRAVAMSFLTPLKRGGAVRLRLRLALYRYGFGLFQRQVASLSFLHFASWSVVRRLPGPDQGRRRGPARLLFQSNYNGPWHTYIETFSALVGGGIGKILATSAGFPGVAPVHGFKDYLEGHEHLLGHYWSAYSDQPEASATVITAALDLDRRLDRLARRARRMPDRKLAATLPAFLTSVQKSLAGGAPRRVPRHWRARPAHNVTVVTPIGDDRVEGLRHTLASFGPGPASPLAGVDGLHLARWAVLDWVQDSGRPGPVGDLGRPGLLFSAEFQGRPKAALAALVAGLGGRADDLWGQCERWPGSGRPEEAARYLARHLVRSHLYFAAYRRHDVGRVRRAIDRRRRLVQLVADAQGRTGADQLVAFRRILNDPT